MRFSEIEVELWSDEDPALVTGTVGEDGTDCLAVSLESVTSWDGWTELVRHLGGGHARRCREALVAAFERSRKEAA